jgi:hypothetical protein
VVNVHSKIRCRYRLVGASVNLRPANDSTQDDDREDRRQSATMYAFHDPHAFRATTFLRDQASGPRSGRDLGHNTAAIKRSEPESSTTVAGED